MVYFERCRGPVVFTELRFLKVYELVVEIKKI